MVEKEKNDEKLNEIKKSISLVGEKVHLESTTFITDVRMLVMGSNIHINENSYLDTMGGLIIGDNVIIDKNVKIYTSSLSNEGGEVSFDKINIDRVIIENNVYIGENVTILPGVKIGKESIIGMGSVITEDVPDRSNIGNQIYRLIKTNNNGIIKNLILKGENERFPELPYYSSDNYVSGNDLGDKLFFIVSTGRSGTTSLAHILNQHPEITCKHEITDILISLSTQYEHNEIKREEAKEILKKIYYEYKIFPKNNWFGESNHKLSNLIPILHELLPKAKFIWLIRDGKKVVNSLAERAWYPENYKHNSRQRDLKVSKWENFRIVGYKTGDFSKIDWEKMTVFEKNCWYWSKWNRKIDLGLINIPENQKFILKLENLNTSYHDLLNFLGLSENFDFKEEKRNIGNHKKRKPTEWNAEQNAIFFKHCEKLYSRFYS